MRCHLGTLWTRRKQGREGASFAYSERVIQEVFAALEGWVAVAKACGLNSSQICWLGWLAVFSNCRPRARSASRLLSCAMDP